mmetsp:Transcript_98361/g.194983  ORF Transcript_98361/g.194983 Transcript_98361/m.194983 type:complete len:323 (+) Transcript_98361:953-1921(+)
MPCAASQRLIQNAGTWSVSVMPFHFLAVCVALRVSVTTHSGTKSLQSSDWMSEHWCGQGGGGPDRALAVNFVAAVTWRIVSFAKWTCAANLWKSCLASTVSTRLAFRSGLTGRCLVGINGHVQSAAGQMIRLRRPGLLQRKLLPQLHLQLLRLQLLPQLHLQLLRLELLPQLHLQLLWLLQRHTWLPQLLLRLLMQQSPQVWLLLQVPPPQSRPRQLLRQHAVVQPLRHAVQHLQLVFPQSPPQQALLQHAAQPFLEHLPDLAVTLVLHAARADPWLRRSSVRPLPPHGGQRDKAVPSRGPFPLLPWPDELVVVQCPAVGPH